MKKKILLVIIILFEVSTSFSQDKTNKIEIKEIGHTILRYINAIYKGDQNVIYEISAPAFVQGKGDSFKLDIEKVMKRIPAEYNIQDIEIAAVVYNYKNQLNSYLVTVVLEHDGIYLELMFYCLAEREKNETKYMVLAIYILDRI